MWYFSIYDYNAKIRVNIRANVIFYLTAVKYVLYMFVIFSPLGCGADRNLLSFLDTAYPEPCLFGLCGKIDTDLPQSFFIFKK